MNYILNKRISRICNWLIILTGVYFAYIIYDMIHSGTFAVVELTTWDLLFGIDLVVKNPFHAGYYFGEIEKCRAIAILLMSMKLGLFVERNQDKIKDKIENSKFWNATLSDVSEGIKKKKG